MAKQNKSLSDFNGTIECLASEHPSQLKWLEIAPRGATLVAEFEGAALFYDPQGAWEWSLVGEKPQGWGQVDVREAAKALVAFGSKRVKAFWTTKEGEMWLVVSLYGEASAADDSNWGFVRYEDWCSLIVAEGGFALPVFVTDGRVWCSIRRLWDTAWGFVSAADNPGAAWGQVEEAVMGARGLLWCSGDLSFTRIRTNFYEFGPHQRRSFLEKGEEALRANGLLPEKGVRLIRSQSPEEARKLLAFEAERNEYSAGGDLAAWWFDVTRVKRYWIDGFGEVIRKSPEEVAEQKEALKAKYLPTYEALQREIGETYRAEIARIEGLTDEEALAEAFGGRQ